jgi:hypothetical protein
LLKVIGLSILSLLLLAFTLDGSITIIDHEPIQDDVEKTVTVIQGYGEMVKVDDVGERTSDKYEEKVTSPTNIIIITAEGVYPFSGLSLKQIESVMNLRDIVNTMKIESKCPWVV